MNRCLTWVTVAIALIAITAYVMTRTETAQSKTVPQMQTEPELTAADREKLCSLAVIDCGDKPQAYIATAYSAEPRQTDSTPCIAADGTDICIRNRDHETICATNDLPMGTRVTLSDGITCTVADRMNRRYDGRHRIDIFFGHDTRGAVDFGKQELLLTKE